MDLLSSTTCQAITSDLRGELPALAVTVVGGVSFESVPEGAHASSRCVALTEPHIAGDPHASHWKIRACEVLIDHLRLYIEHLKRGQS